MKKEYNILLYSAITRMLPTTKIINEILKRKSVLPEEAKVLFVPFADETNKYYIALCKQALLLAGIKKSNISTLSSHTHKTAKADVIFVSGGNVCKLKDALTQIDWLQEIKERIEKGVIYIGDSAGAVILGQTIEHTLDWEPYESQLDNYNGLGVLDKSVVVHYSLKKYAGEKGVVKEQECYDAHVKQVKFLGKKNCITVANNQVIVICGGKQRSKFLTWRKIAKSTKAESKKYHKK